MARGRKPEPVEIKEAKGNPGRRRIAHAPADVRDLSPAPPLDLSDGARLVWDRLAPDLTRLKFLRETDRHAFARYCEHLARWWTLTVDLRAEGETYLSKSQHNPDGLLRMNPKFLLRERIEKRIEFLEDRFGLSPMARQQILQRLAGMTIGPAPPAGDVLADADAPADSSPPASPVGLLARGGLH